MSAAAVLSATWRGVRDQYRLGLGLFAAAPVAVALVGVPEFVQHVVEIELGMFDSRAAARALSADPTRWAFGYAKLAGLLLAFLACARAVWCRLEGGRWYDPAATGWARLVVGFVLFLLVGSLGMPLARVLGGPALMALNTILSVASVPFLFVALAGLFGDRGTSSRALLTRCWPAVALLVLLMVTGFGPGQALHYLDHRLALGQPRGLVWALMAWDALVVGGMAALTGAAFALSYRTARRRAA